MRTNAAPGGVLTRLLLANVLFGSGLFAHAFLYNFYLEALGRGPAQMGIAFSALTAGGLAALIPSGALVDRVGARAAYLAAAAIGGIGLAWGAVAEGLTAVYAAAFLAGAGTAAWRVATGPLLIAATDGATRARAFSWNIALLVGSGAAWTLGAGYLPGVFGGGLPGARATLAIGALGTLASAPLIPSVPTARSVGEAAAERVERGLARLAIPAPLAVAVVLIGLWMAASGMVLPFFNLWLNRAYHVPVERVGGIMAGAQLLAGAALVLGGEGAARRGALRMLPVWVALFPVAMLALAAGPVLGMAIGIFALQGIVPPASNALIDQLLLEGAPLHRRGAVSSWRGAATEGSGFVASAAGGFLLENSGFPVLFAVSAALAAAAGTALVLLLRRSGTRLHGAQASSLPLAGTEG